ncbi:SAM-dependent methyltransferase [Thiotrichales bacterium 19S3-7]|nr:SAM-dependent methyltransferase [Thiotrichales bacterium 19S3-7]MCF6801434.1 SAM-dependent methyltransferase [Thiotrichales bacterium 19S3-11]
MMRVALELSDQKLILQSKKIIEMIKLKIKKNQSLFFDEYMQLALYTPQLGYYASAANILGESGDFTTAPELTSLFAACFANSFSNILETIEDASILEFGAGSGQFALALLQSLAEKKLLPKNYYILEVNAYLKVRQQELLQQKMPDYFECIKWLDELPKENSFKGVIFANEVIDAMPVVRFIKREHGINELAVTVIDDQLELIELPARDTVIEKVSKIESVLESKIANGYLSEINLWVENWISALAGLLQQGALFLVDYGYEQRDFYRSDRSMGTLQCYFQHKVHDDALWSPGVQDITAHVDFTAVAQAAVTAGLDFEGYTTQAAFLSNCGLDPLYQAHFAKLSTKLQLELASKIKTLLMPGAMGEVFKVIAFSQNLKADLEGFELNDLSYRL